MKKSINKIICFMVSMLLVQAVMAQVPQGLNYQAVARDVTGALLDNKAINMRLTVHQGSASGTAVYAETHAKTTNSLGLFTLTIGQGTITSPGYLFTSIDWSTGNYWLQVELKIGTGSYTDMGTSQLVSVPYALQSQKANEIPDNSVTNLKLSNNAVTAPKLASMGATAGQVLTWSGTAWTPQTSTLNPWSSSGSNIYFNTGKVGIGAIPGSSLRNFQSVTTDMQAVAGVNNSSTYATIFGENLGSGPAADFRNNIRITDGTQGAGKVLTSDANGFTSWQTPGAGTSPWLVNGSNLYYNLGNIGIGTNTPDSKLHIVANSSATSPHIKLYEDASDDYARISFMNTSGAHFWAIIAKNASTADSKFNIYNSIEGNVFSILGNGNVGIGTGTSSPLYKLDVVGPVNLNKGIASGQALLVNGAEAIWYNGTYFSWGYGGTFNTFNDPVGINCLPGDGHKLAVNGVASKPGGGTWTAFSDARLKNIHGDFERGLADILCLHPVRFSYKPGNPLDLPSNKDYVGFIAQEVQKVFPETVIENKNGFLEFDMQGVNVALINAIKELKAENDLLRSRLEKVEASLGISSQK